METTIDNIKKTNWGTIIAWVIAILGLGSTLYFGLKKNKSDLEYDIVSMTDFFNNSESVPYIKVLIEDSIDVQENHYNITAYNIKVENKGSKDIGYHDYDEGFFGLMINNGIVLDVPRLLSASNNHIAKNFRTDTIAKGTSRIEIPKITLDTDENYIIKIVLLHDMDSIPRFYTEGKILGQKEIKINEMQNSDRETYITNRIAIILQLFMTALAILMIVLNKRTERLMYNVDNMIVMKNERIGQLMEKEKNNREDEIRGIDIIPSVKEEFINNGYWAISGLYKIFTSGNELEATEKYRKMYQFIMDKKNAENVEKEEFNRVKQEYEKYNYYIEKKYFSLNTDISIVFNNDAKESVIKLYEYLSENKRKENRSVDEILNTSTIIHYPNNSDPNS